MPRTHLARLSTLVVIVAAVLTACAPASPVQPEALPHLAETLTALRTANISIGTLTISKNIISVDGSQNNQNVHLRAFPNAETPTPSDARTPIAPWSQFDPAAVAAQAVELSKQCPDDFVIKIEAVTVQAVLSTVSCPGAKVTSAALLNNKPLPAFDGSWSPHDWQTLIDEWTTLSASGTLWDVLISNTRVSISLASPEQTNNCSPILSQSLDGVSNANLACLQPDQDSGFSFSNLTGDEIATQAAIIMADHGMTNGLGLFYDLHNSRDRPTLTVSQGDRYGKVVLASH